jgi:purine catabolism regulator
VLAAASVGPIDALRARSIEQHRTPQEIATFLHQEGLFERLQRDRRPQLLFPIPRFGMELERLVAPILVGSDLYGYIWIIASEVPLGELDFLAIERAANVAALIFTRERAIYETAQRIKSGQLDDLLQLDPYRQFVNIREALAHMGIQETFQAMVIEPHCLGMDMRRLTRVLEQNLEREKIKGFAVDRGGKVVVGFSPQDPNHGREFAQMLQTDMGELQIPISIGIGRFSLDPSEFPHSYREALESLRIGCKLALQKPGIWLYQDLGFSLWLDSIPTKVVSASSAGKVIESIAEHDEKKGTEYLRTLEAYIDCLGSQQKAAERLYIHRNTLRQRLARLSDLWPMDLRDPIVFFNISAAVRHWRLNSLE